MFDNSYHRVKLLDLPPAAPLCHAEVAAVLDSYHPGDRIQWCLPDCLRRYERRAAGSVVSRDGTTRSRKKPCSSSDQCRSCYWYAPLERAAKIWRAMVLASVPWTAEQVCVLRVPEDKRLYNALQKWWKRRNTWAHGLRQQDGTWVYVLGRMWVCVEHNAVSEPYELPTQTALRDLLISMTLTSKRKGTEGGRERLIRGSKRPPEDQPNRGLATIAHSSPEHRQRMCRDAGISFVIEDGTREPQVHWEKLVIQGSDWLREYGYNTGTLNQDAIDLLIVLGEEPNYARLGGDAL